MIDFVKATKYNCKDSLFLGHCKDSGIRAGGGNMYFLEGCERMKIWHYPHSEIVRVEGSLPYFLNGHNFTSNIAEFVQSVEIVDSLLGGIGLWGADVEVFENGVIMPVECKPKEYIARHYASAKSGLKRHLNDDYRGKSIMWERNGEQIKLYDAGANIKMKQGMKRREVIAQAGWNPEGNYLKFEVRYTKPSLVNGNRSVRLEKLQNQSFLDKLKEDLMKQYQLLMPARSLVLPSDKKNFSSLDAVLFALVESGMNELGLSPEEAKKKVFSIINQADCLSKADKDARKAQIRKAFGKLEESPDSKWDLAEALVEALNAEG